MVRVALVGYTNVGKSTLMNLISKSEVFAENKLFATLDTTVRKVVFDNLPFLLSDTVGFIRKLPTELIESFKSTLDEVREADLLVHVVDISHPQFEEQIDEMSTWKDQRLNEAKEILAYELTSMVHGKEEAEKAQNAARALFSGSAMDTEHMPSTQLTEADLTDGSIGILTLMVKAGLAASNGEARRLVVQGGVLADGEKVAAPSVSFTAEQLKKGIVIKKGKKVYHKVTL